MAYVIEITSGDTGDKATKVIGTWRDHAVEVYASWRRRLPTSWTVSLIDSTESGDVVLYSDNGEKKQ